MSLSRRTARIVLALLVAGAALMVGVMIASGARDFGTSLSRPPCTPAPAFPGDGLDATLQRVVLDGLEGAACELGATREELVLSLAPSDIRPRDIRWDDATIQRAVRSGLVQSIDQAEDRGSLPGPLASVLRAVAERAPVEFLINRGGDLAGIVDAVRSADPGDLLRLLGRIDPGDLLDLIRP
ncbi:MAG: hypothetical protein MUE51_15175 [Thermoleophilia bacterium]|nr:hypothetical protein [Thermoleophilia bacterium]